MKYLIYQIEHGRLLFFLSSNPSQTHRWVRTNNQEDAYQFTETESMAFFDTYKAKSWKCVKADTDSLATLNASLENPSEQIDKELSGLI